MLAVFLDFDGTIAELDRNPANVRLDERFKSTIGKLLEHNKVIITSGRDVVSLRDIFSGLQVGFIACHGAEIILNGQSHVLLSDAEQKQIEALKADIVHTKWPAHLIENKSCSIAIHSSQDHMQTIEQGIISLLQTYADIGYILGKNVIEIKPRSIDKGRAIRYVIENKIDKCDSTIFIGDDTTDIPALEYVDSIGGITGFVGNDLVRADMHFSSPTDCRHWLSKLSKQKIQLQDIKRTA